MWKVSVSLNSTEAWNLWQLVWSKTLQFFVKTGMRPNKTHGCFYFVKPRMMLNTHHFASKSLICSTVLHHTSPNRHGFCLFSVIVTDIKHTHTRKRAHSSSEGYRRCAQMWEHVVSPSSPTGAPLPLTFGFLHFLSFSGYFCGYHRRAELHRDTPSPRHLSRPQDK